MALLKQQSIAQLDRPMRDY
ncbi:hypothetical protein Hamer_G002983 [Homarus americanus]|uniref:Uncharacterized protein n=1 Tax=Homarus americanus TaxID=6706 RepID=A0A8J5MU66_HOMAM|nr:hypothetical protein Hamer_G002983 [Homarus americanus]